LQGKPDLRTGFWLLAFAGEFEVAVHRVPELGKRCFQILLLVRRSVLGRYLPFAAKRIF
jgi:hypothetical protein